MKSNLFYTFMLLYLMISSNFIDTKNVIRKSILLRNSLKNRIQRFQKKMKTNRGIWDIVSGIINAHLKFINGLLPQNRSMLKMEQV